MAILFSPTGQDVERYRLLRTANVKLSQRILETVPKQAWDEIGSAVGALRNGVLVLDNHGIMSVIADCLLYNWLQDGKNVVQQFASTHVMEPGSDEDILLRGCLSAKYRILEVQSAEPGAGLYCKDLQRPCELFLMDAVMSKHSPKGYSFATRTVPIEEYWITGGAAMPIDQATRVDTAYEQLQRDYPHLLAEKD